MTQARRPHRNEMVGKALLLLVTAACWLFTATGVASAHAALLTSDPVPGSVAKVAPRQVTLVFGESVRLFDDSIRVIAPDGRRVDAGTPQNLVGEQNAGRVALREDLQPGSYTVAWRAVSADSHIISGAFVFAFGHTSATASVPAVRAAPAISMLYGTARALGYVGYALTVGTAGFVLVCWPAGANHRGVRRLLLAGWITLTTATASALALSGPYQSAGTFSQMFDTSLLSGTLHTPIGGALAQRMVLLAAVGPFLWLLCSQLGRELSPLHERREEAASKQRDIRRGLTAAGVVLAGAIAVNWASAGHAAEGIQVPLALLSDSLHLLSMGLWIGGLVALLVTLKPSPGPKGPTAASVDRFSVLAESCVAVLVVTGIYQSWRGLGSWGAMTGSGYGRLLLLKVGAVVLLVALGALSRRHLVRQRASASARSSAPSRQVVPGTVRVLERADTAPVINPDDPRRLRRSVAAETAVAVIVLAVTTLLTNSAPGRSQAVAAPGSVRPADIRTAVPYDTGGAGPDASGRVVVSLRSAPDTGASQLTAEVINADGRAARVAEVRMAFTLPSRDVGPLRVVLSSVGAGRWTTPAVQLPFPGDWQMAVTVRSSDIDEATRTTSLRIG
ncbi:ABC transporter [Streptomyces sp. So13.3]|uniref:copper resistance CopC/CopD family protein n=1 Tax=unclassified Streptomyces TaxID=2593676 RepID=UPI0011075C2C|nr:MULTISPECIES: copper resistance protein CopC [unclassified Streptomyces]MCZ4102299.1 copper resistance protein CopC [Streptomyces sp. H39-C1]QNA76376.1 ABC transporter [Streptomyces sp. So13.3]